MTIYCETVSEKVSEKGWAVGEDGENNWDVVYADSEEEALDMWRMEYAGDNPIAERKPAWDGLAVEAGDENWFKASMGVSCGVCRCETWIDDGACWIDGRVVCADCLHDAHGDDE